MTTSLSADEATRITSSDPAFTRPSRPRLLPGLVVLPVPDGLLVEGAERRQLFRGMAASGLLPPLVEHLSRSGPAATVAELASRLRVPLGHVSGAIDLLYARGLLDDEPVPRLDPAPARGPGSADGAALWAIRHMDSSRLHRSREHVVQALTTTRVQVVGDAELSSRLRECLAAHGVTIEPADRVGTDAHLVVVVGRGQDDLDLLRAVEASSTARAGDWLRVLVREDEVQLGPVGGPADGHCVTCLWRAGLLRPVDGPGVGLLSGELATALIAVEVVHLLSGSGRALSTTGVVTLETSTWRHALHPCPRTPDCPSCSRSAVDVGSPEQTTTTSLAHVFDAAVRFPPTRRQRPKDHQQHYAASNLALQHAVTPSRDAVALLPTPGTARRRRGLDVQTLSVLLHRGFGWLDAAGGERRRCLPTGGNIGSPSAYLVVRAVDGLSAGRYRYAPQQHGLARVGGPEEDLGCWVDLGDVAGPPWQALLVLSGNLERTSSKYLEFGARVVHLDAGVALAQVRLTAGAEGVRCRAARRWDDVRLAAALGIDFERSPVTAVAALDGAAAGEGWGS